MRLLGPADFGVYSLLLAVTGIAGVIVDVGLTEAAVKHIAAAWPGQREKAVRQAQVFFWLRVGLAGGGVLLGSLLAPVIAAFLLERTDGTFLVVLALLGMAVTALNGSINALLQATGNFSRISAVMIFSSGIGTLITVILVLAGTLNLVTVLVGVGIGTALSGFWLGRYLLPKNWGEAGQSPLQFPGLGPIRRDSKPLFKFGRWLWVSNIVKILVSYLDVFLINHWLSAATLGIYALALSLASKAEIVNHSLYTVLVPTASAIQGKQALRNYLRIGLIRSGLISLGLILLAPVAIWFIPFFYGAEYQDSVSLFMLLLAVAIFDILTLPPLLLIYTFDRSDVAALAETVRLGALVLTGVWLIPILGPFGAVGARFVAKLLGFGFTLVLLIRHYRQM